LRDFIELGALDSSVPCARYHARQILWEWGLTRLSDSVELVVAELMTNAVSASHRLEWPSPVRLWLLSDRGCVLVVVWDAGPRAPALIELADLAESGRGLALVDALSARWDWYATPGAAGKVVHALITG
jgi:anti-sigma regulatory factor (Ser/Thr protein kinase)